MHNHSINKLLNIEDVIVKKVVHADSFVKIYLETNPSEQICPCCGSKTKRIHDYRLQTIKDLPFQLKNCLLVLRKRRYVCSCGKKFYEKYQCILVDPIKHRVLDIISGRKQQQLIHYFSSFPKSERYKVKFFVCDMWQPYVDMAQIYFPHAKIVIDKYHFTRQTGWAIEGVRKRLQKTMPVTLRKYYKHSRRLICQNPKYSEQRTMFWAWVKEAESCGIKEFENCAKTYRTWSEYILNAYKYSHISNGPTEGFNNKIKVLKRCSYGIRNFEHFRTRILMVTN